MGRGRLAPINKVTVANLPADVSSECVVESIEGAPDVATRVPKLQQSDINNIQGGAGNGSRGLADPLHGGQRALC